MMTDWEDFKVKLASGRRPRRIEVSPAALLSDSDANHSSSSGGEIFTGPTSTHSPLNRSSLIQKWVSVHFPFPLSSQVYATLSFSRAKLTNSTCSPLLDKQYCSRSSSLPFSALPPATGCSSS